MKKDIIYYRLLDNDEIRSRYFSHTVGKKHPNGRRHVRASGSSI